MYNDLSYAQKALWIRWKKNKNDYNYNLPIAFRLKHDLDLKLLSHAFNIYLNKHPILRTNFIEEHGSIKQNINQGSQLKIKEINLSTQIEDEIVVQLKHEYRKPFDLENELLIRVCCFHITNQQSILLITCHHIITDGFTPDSLQEVFDIYDAIASNIPYSFEADAGYSYYVQDEINYLSSVNSQNDLEFWRQDLTNTAVVQIQSDELPKALSEQNSISCRVNADLFIKIQEFARHRRCSVFTLYLAALKILIFKYTGSSDVCIGTSIKNILTFKYQQSLGYFSNTVIVRTPVQGVDLVNSVINSTQRKLLEAMQHGCYPFSKLQEELKINLASDCPFPASIVYHDRSSCFYDLSQHKLSERLISIPIICQDSEFSLNLEVLDGYHDALLLFKYQANKISLTTINQIKTHFVNVLTQIIQDKNENTIAEMDILSAEEKQKIIFDWNQTAHVWHVPHTIADVFRECVKQYGDRVALQSENIHYTYQELDDLSDKLATHLWQMVGNEKLIAICMNKGPHLIISILAAYKANLAYLPIDPTYPSQRIEYMLNDSKVKFLLVDENEQQDKVNFEGKVISASKLMSCDVATQLHETNSDNSIAYVMFTSGSTGNPKPVMVTQKGVINLAKSQVEHFNVLPTSRILQFASISFDAAVSEIWTALFSGATLVIPKERYLSGAALIDIINQYQISVITLPSSILSSLPDNPVPSLKTLVLAGEMVSEKLLALWLNKVEKLINAYGPTETTVCATLFHCQTPEANIIGKPIHNMQIYILDADLNPVPQNVPGEIYIGGAGVSCGYMNHTELTDPKFIRFNNIKLYKTGDLAKFLPDGNIQYLGRLDNQIKLRGHRINPEEIENCLSSHPDIETAIVMAHENERDEKTLHAYLQLKKNKLSNQYPHHSLWWPSTAEFYVYDDILYGAMTKDTVRNNIYRKCISHFCQNKIVVDVGTGKDAILARMCIEEGAKHVYAIEYLHATYLKAKETLTKLNLLDRITLIQGDAREVRLDEKADVIISEIVGPIGGAEGSAEIIAKVKNNLLKENGLIIPDKSITYIAAVSLTDKHLESIRFTGLPLEYQKKIFDQISYPFDLRVCVSDLSYADLASSKGVFEHLNYANRIKITYDEHVSSLQIEKNTTIHGFLIWLTLEFFENDVLDILTNKYCWLPVFVPVFYPGIQVKPGDEIELNCSRMLSENGLNQDYHIKGTVKYQDGRSENFEYDMPHFEKQFKHNLFYQKLFADENDSEVVSPVSEEDVRNYLIQKLPAYMIPNQFIFLDALPKLPNGKVNRKELIDYSMPISTSYSNLTNDEEKIADIFANVLNIDSRFIHPENNFFQLGGSSLSAIQAVSTIKDKLHISITIEEFFNDARVDSLAARLKNNNIISDKINTIENDLLSLPTQFLNLVADKKHVAIDIKHILLTGVTGFLGVYLLDILLQETNATVHCLVRGKNQADCEKRIDGALQTYSLSVNRDRVRVYNADLSSSRLGLADDEYDKLANIIDTIYHCGAEVHHLYNYNLLRSTNVLGVVELIQFALTHQMKSIHYISTLDVALFNADNSSDERAIPMNQMGYIQTKWVAEKLLRHASLQHQLPIRIYRPGNIMGDSKNGRIIPFKNHFWLLIKGCLQLGYAPSWDWKVEMTPVDIVANAIVKLSLQNSEDTFCEYNLHNPSYLTWQQYVDTLNQLGHNCELIDFAQWKLEHLSKVNSDNALHPFKSYYLTDNVDSNKSLDQLCVKDLHKQLKSFGISYPNDYSGLATQYFNHLKAVGFF